MHKSRSRLKQDMTETQRASDYGWYDLAVVFLDEREKDYELSYERNMQAMLFRFD